MITFTAKNFNLSQIANSGQCFRMNPLVNSNSYSLIAFGKYIELTQNSTYDTISVYGATEKEFEKIWVNYFDLNNDYLKIIDSIDPNDKYLTKAAKIGSGIRILNQDLWEVMVSFIISQNNNIPRIKKSIETLCRNCGEERITFNGNFYYCFPTPEQLLDVERLKSARLGYREKYIYELAKNVCARKIDINNLQTKEQLKSIYGIGEKVANCIILFGLHDLSSFPIDVWMKRIIDEQYNGKFPLEKYHEYAGVIQQYMFFDAIQNKNKGH